MSISREGTMRRRSRQRSLEAFCRLFAPDLVAILLSRECKIKEDLTILSSVLWVSFSLGLRNAVDYREDFDGS